MLYPPRGLDKGGRRVRCVDKTPTIKIGIEEGRGGSLLGATA
jgi:hypothetical protein